VGFHKVTLQIEFKLPGVFKPAASCTLLAVNCLLYSEHELTTDTVFKIE
jgi:hypothetical protein